MQRCATVGDACHQRGLGADDDEVGPGVLVELGGQRRGGVDVVTMVAAGPGDGCLAPTVADDEHLHRAPR